MPVHGADTSEPARRRSTRKTIRYKLILLVMTPLSMAVALITGVSAWRDAVDAAALESDRLTSTAKIIAAVAVDSVEARDRNEAFAALRSVAQMEDVTYARVELENGEVLAETGSGARLTRDVALESGAGGFSPLDFFRTRSIQVTEPVRLGDRKLGSVVMLSRTQGAIGRTNTGLAVTLFGAALSALAGLAVAFRLQRSISQPILGLTEAMSSVRRSRDYNLEADLESDDEVGDLIDGFNQMLHEIRDRDARLAEHVQNLEQEVAERTVDLRAAKDAAEAANASKSDFLATMSHEIRTPMNGIMVMAEMLASAEMPQRQRRYAEVIAKSGRSLLSIINDILDFSKIEAGKMELEQVPVDLSEIADDVASLFWERARHKHVDLAVFVDPATPRKVLGDPVRLRQVIGNLVNNAIKFTETGGVLIRVEPTGPAAVRVSVQDTGIGIPADKVGGLFEAFTQVDQSTTRRFGGTGLGLAICKRLVDAMEGAVSVSSVEGRGSTFTVDVPARVVEPAQPWPLLEATACARVALALKAGISTRFVLSRYLGLAGAVPAETGEAGVFFGDAAAIESAAALPRPAICVAEYGDSRPLELLRSGAIDAVLVQPLRRSDLEAVLLRLRDGSSLADLQSELQSQASGPTMPLFEGRRILVADDSAVNREVAVEALSRLGASAVVVEDGAQAVRTVAQDGTFDLVLMDGSMPEMDGFAATKAIRDEERRTGQARLPVVALTAHVVGTGADAWREAGMDAVLHKPFTLAALAQTIARFLEPSGHGAALAPADASPATPAPSAVESDPLLDAAVTADLAALAASGKGDFVERIQRLYRNNAPQSLAAIKDAQRAGDGAALASAAHALKSMSYNVGARKVAMLCAELEAVGRDGQAAPRSAVRDLAVALEATLRALHSQGTANAEAAAEASLLADFKAALLHGPERPGELSMVYQAQMDRMGQELVGCEALVRWNHPRHGPVSPSDFVPMAERAGIVGDLTEFVVRRVCADTAEYPDLKVSFNASALEFSKPGFAERMAALIADCGFDPQRLEVEITETAVVDDAANARTNIERLRAMGVKVALDDFGAGFTSLRFLRMFPFDKLKIDREFIKGCETDTEAATIVHAVVAVGRALGMKVVAEGVETEAERSFLKVAGVHALQGWLFGKAGTIESFAARYNLRRVPARRAA